MVKINSRRMIELVGGKVLTIPKEGWNRATFIRNGLPMIRAMHRTAQIVTKQNTAHVARLASELFHVQLSEVLSRFLNIDRAFHGGRSATKKEPDPLEIFVGADKNLLLNILSQVLGNSAPAIRAKVLPPVQSVMAQGYAKTSALLGQVAEDHSVGLQIRSRRLAEKITGLSDRTRNKFENLLTEAVDNKLSVVETVRKIQKEIPKFNAARAITIARTELGNAWTQGALQSFKESSTITEVSVIGCDSREEERWSQPSYQQYLYRGESTCNIQDVPIGDAEKLNFHVNHTGTIIPSAFSD